MKPAILNAHEAFVVVPVEPVREQWAAMADTLYGYKNRHHDKVAGDVFNAMLAARPDPTALADVVRYVEELEVQAAFTISDASRLLRKEDVQGVCPHPDDCFYESDRARCGPCAVKASAAKGVVVDDTFSHLPEVCRLRREVKAAEARVAELEAQRDAAFAMSKCECGPDEACQNLAKSSARITALEADLGEAERALEPFAKRAGKLDGIWKDHETQWSPEYGDTAITIGHLRAVSRTITKIKETRG